MSRTVTARFPVAHRGPAGLKERIQYRVSRAEQKLADARKAADAHRSAMMRARFSPEGYRAAVAKQKKLDAEVKAADSELRMLRSLR